MKTIYFSLYLFLIQLSSIILKSRNSVQFSTSVSSKRLRLLMNFTKHTNGSYFTSLNKIHFKCVLAHDVRQ